MPDPERPDPSESDIARTVALTEKDLKDAARLLRLLADPKMAGNGLAGFFAPQGKPAAGGGDRDVLVARARTVLNGRRIRRQYFDRDIFGEPAWEILLALYINEASGARLTMSKLAEWIEAPLTTVVRWVKALEEQSLVGRAEHPTDRRIIFIRLHDKARKALDDYLTAIAS
jgi:DNA-binding MarR family transcriptional regulator